MFQIIIGKANITMKRLSMIQYGVNSRAQGSLAQDSMTNNLYFHFRDFSRIFVTYCVKYEAVSTNMLYISCVIWVF